MECWHLRNDQIHGKGDATSRGSVQLKTTGIHCAWSCKREMYKRKDRKNICEGTIVLVFVSLDNTNQWNSFFNCIGDNLFHGEVKICSIRKQKLDSQQTVQLKEKLEKMFGFLPGKCVITFRLRTPYALSHQDTSIIKIRY